MKNTINLKLIWLLILADAAAGLEGLEGTAPYTVAPFEFVMFNTDELMLQFHHT